MVASDNGSPPLSSSAVINVDISDVNDNPPLFSQANYSLIIQVSAKGGLVRDGEEEKKRGGLQWTQREGLTGWNNGRLFD